jgi:hypothetical protein
MTTVWQISQMERTLADGGVVVAHWRATLVDGEHSASSYGTCGFTPDPSDPSFVAYDSITEDMALSWCWDNGVDKNATEASLAAKIELDKNPTQGVGVPW